MDDRVDQDGLEEYEHVPWSHLVPDDGTRWGRPALLAAAALVGLALGVGGTSLVTGRSEAPVAGLPVVTVTGPPGSLAEPVEAVSSPPPTLGSESLPPPALYSEADLQAVLPDQEIRLATAQAELFLVDYFTADGQPGAGDAARTALPGSLGDELPHQAGWGLTYVEWVEAYRVESPDQDRYEVEVLARLLTIDDDGAFLRLPVRAFRLLLVRDGQGALSVVDYPVPVQPPHAGRVEPPEPAAGAPDDVATRAEERLSELGLEGEVIAAAPSDGGWRVVAKVDLGPGSFPVTLHLAAG